MQDNYDNLIRKIKRNKKIIISLFVVSVIAILVATMEIRISFMGRVEYYKEGAHPALIIGLLFLAFFLYLLAMGVKVFNPLSSPMETDCDPNKHLIINSALQKPKDLAPIFAMDYFYLGDFVRASQASDKMVLSGNRKIISNGYFNRARCDFFMKNPEYFKYSLEQFKASIVGVKPASRLALSYEKMLKCLDLMDAIISEDYEKIKSLRDIIPWNNNKPTVGFASYIKGLAAYKLGDRNEAVYRLMYAKETLRKSAFAKMAEELVLELS